MPYTQAVRELLRRGAPASLRGRGGFTLIELLIVMVILAVAVGMIAPSVGAGRKQSAVRRSMRQIVSAVRGSSSLAIRNRKRVSLALWPEDGRFSVQGNSKEFILPEFAAFGDLEGGRNGDDQEILFDFYPTGASSGALIEVEYRVAGKSQVYRLRVNPLLSTVSIESDS